jgi:flavin reductase (DIM6/NTAB) family NADH-FMN oxidoreductase RutF
MPKTARQHGLLHSKDARGSRQALLGLIMIGWGQLRFRRRAVEYARIAPIMAQLWAPLAAVSTAWQGRVNAQIALAIGGASIVPQRPRVVVELWKSNYTHDLVLQSGVFALNFLRREQTQLLTELGTVSGRERDKMAHIPYRAGATGSPLLLECFGYLDCRVVNAMDGGDMTCFLAEAVDGETYGGETMTWAYARTVLPALWLERYNEKIQREIGASLPRMDAIDRRPWRGTG